MAGSAWLGAVRSRRVRRTIVRKMLASHFRERESCIYPKSRLASVAMVVTLN